MVRFYKKKALIGKKSLKKANCILLEMHLLTVLNDFGELKEKR